MIIPNMICGILYMVGIDMYKIGDMLWNSIAVPINSLIYNVAGFDIIYYPRPVRDLCYNCRRLKTSALENRSKQMKTDFEEIIPRIANRGIDKMKEGGRDIMGA
jgi:hypothetical protein